MLGSGRGLKATQEHTTIMAIMDVCGGGLLACLQEEPIELYKYTEIQGNRQHGSVELSRETGVLTGHKCELRTAKLT